MDEHLQELYDLGKKLFEEGKYSDAEPILREVIRINPRYADVQNKLGVISNLYGELTEAAGHFEKALELNPAIQKHLSTLQSPTMTSANSRRHRKFSLLLHRFAHPDPHAIDPFIAGKLANEHYRIGNMYLEFNMNDQAIEEYRKAVKLHPKLADVHTKMGIALRNKGEREEAIVHFVKAKVINPNYGPAWIQLGLSYYMEGLSGLAFEEWQKALEYNPNLKEAETTQALEKEENNLPCPCLA